MASLQAYQSHGHRYYRIVESFRRDGKPRLRVVAHLGRVEDILRLTQAERSDIKVSSVSSGAVTALHHLAQELDITGKIDRALAEAGRRVQRRDGLSVGESLLAGMISRACAPRSKRAFAAWAESTTLPELMGFSAQDLDSQHFWDQMHALPVTLLGAIEQAVVREVIGIEQLQPRALAYDTTNFYTYIASNNQRNSLAQRGHNKQGRHNLRQVGLSYVLDGDNGLSLCHHLYRGNVADAEEFPEALHRIVTLLERNQIAPDTVTLVLDKGSAALANTLELEQAGVGWISALPWTQAPVEFRSSRQLTPLSSQEPGVSAAAETMVVHGKEYRCVVKYSAPFAGEQLHSLTTSLSKAMQSMRRLARELATSAASFTERGLHSRIARWLSPQFVGELIGYTLEQREGRWHLQFDFDHQALERLMAQRLGRTVLLTNRFDWTAEQLITAYSGQQHIEQVFRGLKDGDWLGWGPMYHWTDQKIRVHAFYCMLGISLLQYVRRQAVEAWPGLSTEELLEQLRQIQKYTLLYPPQGEKGPNRVATVLSKQTLTQQRLTQVLGLDQLGSTQRG